MLDEIVYFCIYVGFRSPDRKDKSTSKTNLIFWIENHASNNQKLKGEEGSYVCSTKRDIIPTYKMMFLSSSSLITLSHMWNHRYLSLEGITTRASLIMWISINELPVTLIYYQSFVKLRNFLASSDLFGLYLGVSSYLDDYFSNFRASELIENCCKFNPSICSSDCTLVYSNNIGSSFPIR